MVQASPRTINVVESIWCYTYCYFPLVSWRTTYSWNWKPKFEMRMSRTSVFFILLPAMNVLCSKLLPTRPALFWVYTLLHVRRTRRWAFFAVLLLEHHWSYLLLLGGSFSSRKLILVFTSISSKVESMPSTRSHVLKSSITGSPPEYVACTPTRGIDAHWASADRAFWTKHREWLSPQANSLHRFDKRLH